MPKPELISAFKYKILLVSSVAINNYLDGVHFHSWKSYKKWIIQIKKIIEDEKGATVGFVLCSDEIPPPDIFENVPVNFERNNNMMTDIHALSLCDYNFGPPSSFGTWSSWYGTVPRLVVTNDSRIFSLSQFKQTNSC